MTIKTHTFLAHDANGARKRKYRVSLLDVIEGFADVPKKKIDYELYVAANLSPKKKFNRLLHEAIHAIYPSWSEAQVADLADQLTNIAWRVGYRLKEE